MGCQSSGDKLRPAGIFIPTSNPEIDQMYKEMDEAIVHMNKQGGPLIVAIDTFITVTGGSKYITSTAHGLVATLVVTLAEFKGTPGIQLIDHYPGLYVDTEKLRHIESLRAWELWRNLSNELVQAIKDLDIYLTRAFHCAEIPSSIDQALTKLSRNSNIRVIDLRKLQKVLETNYPVMMEAADNFHKSIKKVRDIAEESTAVFEGLRDEECQRMLLELRDRAVAAVEYDPMNVMSRFKPNFEELVSKLLTKPPVI